jgi:hypothetical protein
MGRQIELPVGIHDGNIRGYVRSADGLVVDVSLWNATSLRVRYQGVYFVEDIGCVGNPNDIEGDLQVFNEIPIDDAPSDIRQKLVMSGATESEIRLLRMFQLRDDSSESSLTVICEGIEIHWIDESGTARHVMRS